MLDPASRQTRNIVKATHMEPVVLGRKYDKIAQWWHDQHVDSQYGVHQLQRALRFCLQPGEVLDVGCGTGGRFIRLLQEHKFRITGIDVSEEMIKLARKNHPDGKFIFQDIGTWNSDQTFDLIIAWDSIFHLPLSMQKPVITKLCHLLSENGVIMYTFGDAAYGEHDDPWQNDIFHYSSIGIRGNLKVLDDNGIACKHLELDQWPQNHAYIIGVKT